MLTSPVCIDANLVIALVTARPLSHKAIDLWQDLVQRDHQPVAPFLLRYEVASALFRKAVRGMMDPEDAQQALQEAMALDIRYLDPPGLSLRAFDLAIRLRQPAAYDAHYLALAEHLDCPFWTADERLYNAVHADFPRVRWLGGYQPGV
jgi:predicted nucleic acid-binding protein